jgi:hypothetical protein
MGFPLDLGGRLTNGIAEQLGGAMLQPVEIIAGRTTT